MGAASTAYVNAESYDGSAWTEVNDLTTARYIGGALELHTAAIYFGGTANTSAKLNLGMVHLGQKSMI